jgi:branched-chain amino acid transport system substrate-binding protein
MTTVEANGPHRAFTHATLRWRASGRSALLSALAVASLGLAACGHRMSSGELLAANGSLSSNGPAATTSTGPADETVGGIDQTGTGGGPVATASAGAGPTSPSASGAVGPSSEGCATPGETGPIAIGTVGNYSGPAGSSQVGNARAMQVWASMVNSRGGLCGRQVQVIVVDDHSDPAQYRAALQDLVENRHVVAFSNAAVLTGDAGIAYLESVKVPGVGGSCAVSAEFDSPMYFLPCPRPDEIMHGLVGNAARFGPSSRTFGLITCREVEVCGALPRRVLLAEGGAKEAGVDVVYEAQASIAQPDFTAECLGAKSAKADTVSVVLDLASLQRFGRSCARQDYFPTYSQLSSVSFDIKDQPGLSEMLVAVPTFSFVGAGTPAQQEFQAAMKEFYGKPPGAQESGGWTSAKLIELAATMAARSKGTITSASMIEALRTLKDETLGGLSVPVSFREGGPGIYPHCWFALRATKGQWSNLNDGQPICR